MTGHKTLHLTRVCSIDDLRECWLAPKYSCEMSPQLLVNQKKEVDLLYSHWGNIADVDCHHHTTCSLQGSLKVNSRLFSSAVYKIH